MNDKMIGHQDDCLIDISDGKRPRESSLRQLPPWRAVMIARVAHKAGVMTEDEVNIYVIEARKVGGNGNLRPA